MIRTTLDWEVIANDAARMALTYADDVHNPRLVKTKELNNERASAWANVSNTIRKALKLEET